MKNFTYTFLVAFLSSFLMISGYAQEETSGDKYENIPRRLQEQKDQYDSGDYLFPPKPKNNWSVGIKGGHSFVSGDVSPQLGYVVGLDIRKALGHAFSLRAGGFYGQTNGLDYQRSEGWSKVEFSTPLQRLYRNSAPGIPPLYYNYRMKYFDGGIQALLNLNNINFYKEQNSWNIFLGVGIGLSAYSTRMDVLDENGNIYDFSQVQTISNSPTSPTVGGRRETLDQLKNLLDGTYETRAESHGDEEGVRLGQDTFTINPMVTGVVGVRYRLSRRLELELEHRLAFTNDDLLDGQRYQETGSLTRDFDTYHTTTIGLALRIGKGEESLWWSNPMASIYSDVKDSKDIVKRFTDDMDNDGIPDLYDKEPDTPEGMPVDVQGRTLDSDRDGFPDNIDSEPYTPKDCDVDSRGIALDSDSDGVPDCYDKEPGSNPGALVDAKGITINLSDVPSTAMGSGAGQPCVLPIIYFDLNKDFIKPDFYPELYYIAQLMKSNSSLRIQAIGYTDNRADQEYNMELSQRRVENAVNFIIETYGIDPGRFDINYQGEDNAQIPGLPDNYTETLEALHLANRRVEFECIN